MYVSQLYTLLTSVMLHKIILVISAHCHEKNDV